MAAPTERQVLYKEHLIARLRTLADGMSSRGGKMDRDHISVEISFLLAAVEAAEKAGYSSEGFMRYIPRPPWMDCSIEDTY